MVKERIWPIYIYILVRIHKLNINIFSSKSGLFKYSINIKQNYSTNNMKGEEKMLNKF